MNPAWIANSPSSGSWMSGGTLPSEFVVGVEPVLRTTLQAVRPPGNVTPSSYDEQ